MLLSSGLLLLSLISYLINPENLLNLTFFVFSSTILILIELNFSSGYAQFPERVLRTYSFDESKSNLARILLSLSLSMLLIALLSVIATEQQVMAFTSIILLGSLILCLRFFLIGGNRSSTSSTLLDANLGYLAGMAIIVLIGGISILFLNAQDEELIHMSIYQTENGDTKIYDTQIVVDKEYEYRIVTFSDQSENYTGEIWLENQDYEGNSTNLELIDKFSTSHLDNSTNIYNFILEINQPGSYKLFVYLFEENSSNQPFREIYIQFTTEGSD